jgi:D-aspartate ligase
MKYDKRDKKYKLFEINLRAGRSSYYVTASGYNMAKYVTDDCIYNKKMDITYATNKHLWLIIPKGVLFKYLPHEDLKAELRDLISEGKCTNSLFYNKDFNAKRYMRLAVSHFNHYKRYKKNFGRKGLS